MDHVEVGRIWEGNAPNWGKLARMGCDLYRDHVNTPAFLAMLPDVAGQRGLDIGCGEGYNTRQVAGRGAAMSAVDICPSFIAQAEKLERAEPLGIEYQLASAVELPFGDESFDFAIATMSFMDISETEKVIQEARRVLKPGGFLQFSISHPCFSTPQWGWILDENGRRTAMKCGDYFEGQDGDIVEWIFSSTPQELKKTMPLFKIPVFMRTLSKWLNLLIDTGFALERFDEPKASTETLRKHPSLDDTTIIAYFLIIRCRAV